MKKEALYKNYAKYYDLVYSSKDYKKEAGKIVALVKKYKKSSGKELLDVACGTGKHLVHLRKHFSCTGVDINDGMLRVARKNVHGVKFSKSDMTNLRLGKKFDAVTCLFSAVAYVRTYKNLRKAIRCFAAHLKPGGVVVIEPFVDKAAYKSGIPWLNVYDGKDVKLARLNVSKLRSDVAVLDFHYMVAERNKGVGYFSDRHEATMFERAKFLRIMREEGFQAAFLKNGLLKNRGLYVGVRI